MAVVRRGRRRGTRRRSCALGSGAWRGDGNAQTVLSVDLARYSRLSVRRLPEAEWWVAGPVVTEPRDADVELEEVDRLYTEYDLWDGLTSG